MLLGNLGRQKKILHDLLMANVEVRSNWILNGVKGARENREGREKKIINPNQWGKRARKNR